MNCCSRKTLTKVVFITYLMSLVAISLPLTGSPVGSAIATAITLEQDFGDAPEGAFVSKFFPTLLASNGARHVIVPGYQMGASVEADSDGVPSINANADDVLDESDDEDGLVSYALHPGAASQLVINASSGGYINAFLDNNKDGDWQDFFEQILANAPVVAGDNTLAFTLNAGALSGATYLRIRFNSTGNLFPMGPANDGEVEDYFVSVIPTGSSSSSTSSSSMSGPCYSWISSDGSGSTTSGITCPSSSTSSSESSETSSESSSSESSESSSSSSESSGTGSSTSSSSESSSSSSVDPFFNYCDGFAATIFVNTGGIIVGGPLNGAPYAGLLLGTSGPDVIAGTAGTDYVFGDDGNDVICGKASNDVLDGGSADDSVHGDDGSDLLTGGFGNDRLSGDAGNDVLIGNFGNDQLWGGPDNDHLLGGLGNDVLRGGDGLDVMEGSFGDDDLDGEMDTDAIYGGWGDDSLRGGLAPDFLSGGHGNDLLEGNVGEDILSGGPGQDVLIGGLGSDQMWGGSGNDTLEGELGDDVMRGESGNDTFLGGAGNDKICGGIGNDNASGNIEDDQIDGGAGTDTLNGNGGSDICVNGESVANCEDTVTPVAVCSTDEFDYGDAPDSYGTSLSNNGARHYRVPGVYLGSSIDWEADGAPTVGADGDDLASGDDEDGVDFGPGPLVAGMTGSLTITASVNGYVEAWIDRDHNGIFDVTDKILDNVAVPAGASVHAYSVPAYSLGTTYARFRFTTNGGGLPADDFALDGEVEDYRLTFVEGGSSSSSSESSSSESSSSESSSSSSSSEGSSSSEESSSSSSVSSEVQVEAITGTDSDVNGGNAKHRGSQTNVLRAAFNFTFHLLSGRNGNGGSGIAPGGFGGGPVNATFSQFVAPGAFGGGDVNAPEFNELERSMICRTKFMTSQERTRQNTLLTTWAAGNLARLLNRSTEDIQWGLYNLPCGDRRSPNLGTSEDQ